MRRPRREVIGWTVLVFGGVVLVLAAFLAGPQVIDEATDAQTASGVVDSEVRTRRCVTGEDICYWADVSFVSSDGNSWTTPLGVPKDSDVGTAVEVRYLPGNPPHVIEANAFGSWFAVVFLVVVLPVVGIIMFVVGVRRVRHTPFKACDRNRRWPVRIA